MLGSISTGTDADEENDKIVVVEEDEEDFCTYLNGGAVTNGGDRTRKDCRSDWTNQFEAPLYHCSVNETLLI